MDFLKWRDYAFLSQASYRNLTALLRGADGQALEDALKDDRAGVPSPQNRFAELQAKQLTGSATGSDLTDGYTFLHQTPNGPRGFSASVFAPNDGERAVIAIAAGSRSRLQRRREAWASAGRATAVRRSPGVSFGL